MEEIVPKCLVCGCKIGALSTSCTRCETLYHKDCYDYNGKCAVYGCVEKVMFQPCRQPEATVPPATDRRSNWGETLVGILMMSIIVIPLVCAIIAAGSIPVRPGETVVREYPMGMESILCYGDIYNPDVFKTSRYLKKDYLDYNINFILKDGVNASLRVRVEYELFDDEEKIRKIHQIYGSKLNFETDLIRASAEHIACNSKRISSHELRSSDGGPNNFRLLTNRCRHLAHYSMRAYSCVRLSASRVLEIQFSPRVHEPLIVTDNKNVKVEVGSKSHSCLRNIRNMIAYFGGRF